MGLKLFGAAEIQKVIMKEKVAIVTVAWMDGEYPKEADIVLFAKQMGIAETLAEGDLIEISGGVMTKANGQYRNTTASAFRVEMLRPSGKAPTPQKEAPKSNQDEAPF